MTVKDFILVYIVGIVTGYVISWRIMFLSIAKIPWIRSLLIDELLEYASPSEFNKILSKFSVPHSLDGEHKDS